ncbi:MAG: MotA/TolQ/ExbB proton channel family protein [Rubrivivax sp.]|nr:MotA/TolQ/ExbB proton channel family protein [Rubrivivax sp.]
MSLNKIVHARSWAAKTLAGALASLVLGLGLPGLALAQAPAPAASEPAAAPAAAPAAEQPAPAAAPPAVTVEQEAVDNPFGLRGMWQSSDWVKRGTLIILVIMSMASWYVIFVKLFEQRAMLKSGRSGAETFWKAGSVKAGVGALEEGSAIRFIAEQGIKASEHHEGTMTDVIDKHTWIGMSIERAVGNVQSRLSDGLALLATVGSTAPFVGLFGTTWGIYDALVKIGLSGQASIDKVAGPVGAALILTAVGLAVAVPAVMGYNWLIRRNKTVMDLTRAFAGDLQNVLLSGKR